MREIASLNELSHKFARYSIRASISIRYRKKTLGKNKARRHKFIHRTFNWTNYIHLKHVAWKPLMCSKWFQRWSSLSCCYALESNTILTILNELSIMFSKIRVLELLTDFPNCFENAWVSSSFSVVEKIDSFLPQKFWSKNCSTLTTPSSKNWRYRTLFLTINLSKCFAYLRKPELPSSEEGIQLMYLRRKAYLITGLYAWVKLNSPNSLAVRRESKLYGSQTILKIWLFCCSRTKALTGKTSARFCFCRSK